MAVMIPAMMVIIPKMLTILIVSSRMMMRAVVILCSFIGRKLFLQRAPQFRRFDLQRLGELAQQLLDFRGAKQSLLQPEQRFRLYLRLFRQRLACQNGLSPQPAYLPAKAHQPDHIATLIASLLPDVCKNGNAAGAFSNVRVLIPGGCVTPLGIEDGWTLFFICSLRIRITG
jgi:hypothetical protein